MAIKKIFEGQFDDEVHSDFLKFGRGEYGNRYLLEGKKQSDKWAIKAGAEFSNFLVKKCLEKVSGSVAIKGIIVSTLDLRKEFGFEIQKASNFQGIRKNVIDTKVEPNQILSLMQKYPRVFFALSFSGEDFDLKIKAKAPKSGKPGKADEDGPKADFCTLKTKDKSIVDELFFDYPDFKEISINHNINIQEIVYPKNLNELKPAEVREQSKRKGILVRNISVDGKTEKKEVEILA